ncbi:hypothetical protein [Nocardioides sp.]|uniref:hypothetical protein n=1 Tax=Nocardioides sp. TaxID=35761 RepID=UPI0019C34901|nr:hypothetical protein [Nocardioides sp.]MBC7276430.1 hypothetical protein [Nocardioides sp.]
MLGIGLIEPALVVAVLLLTRLIGSARPAADPLLAKARTYVASARALGCSDSQVRDALERALADSSPHRR